MLVFAILAGFVSFTCFAAGWIASPHPVMLPWIIAGIGWLAAVLVGITSE